MLPASVIKQFWTTVKRELQARFSLPQADARDGINAYRALIKKWRVGEILYHDNPENVAETIACGWRKRHSHTEKNGKPTNGIRHENRFREYIQRKEGGSNGQTAAPKSYVSCLRGIAKLLRAEVSPDLLHSEENIEAVVNKLRGKRQPATIQHYVTAMRHYVGMVRELQLWANH